MQIEAVTSSYARWAPIYDRTFGAITQAARRSTLGYVNRRKGRVLELGVGTGLSLPLYAPAVEVTGIDFSAQMLAKARARAEAMRLANVKALRRMDARKLGFPDNSFDTVVAMHILSVAPEPERIMAEVARVLKPGGEVVIANHFAREKGLLAAVEKMAAPFAEVIGWHSDFPKARVLEEDRLELVTESRLPPPGVMTFLVLRKAA